VIGRIVRSADFERVLRCPPCARTVHFAVHHLSGQPSLPARPGRKLQTAELSTGKVPLAEAAVDELPAPAPAATVRWLGMVIPKRHARRSVTRSLLKRQIRAAVQRHETALAQGLWVVRLRSPFERAQFPSAASAALAAAARAELGVLMTQASA
jgi:ribonuclease P protein component